MVLIPLSRQNSFWKGFLVCMLLSKVFWNLIFYAKFFIVSKQKWNKNQKWICQGQVFKEKKKKKNKTVFRSLWYVDMLQWLTFNKSSCWYILHNPFPPFMDDCKMKPCLWILSEYDYSIGKTLIRRRLFMTLLDAEEKQKKTFGFQEKFCC